jgi:hypothetical protein
MALDPNISLGVKPLQIADPLAQYGQVAQIQAAQQSQQMNALRMQEVQRDIQETNAMRGLDLKDPEYRAKVYGISPARGQAFDVAANEAASKKATTGKTLEETAALQRKSSEEKLANVRFNPSDENLIAHNQDVQKDPTATPQQKANADAITKQFLALPLGGPREKALAEVGTTPANRMVANTAFQGQQSVAESARLGRLTTERGQDMTAATAKAGQGVTLRGQDMLNTREKENILIRQEDQRRKGDPAFIQQMAQASATGAAIAKDQALAQKLLPKVLETANQTLSQIDDLIGKRDEKGALLKGSKPHPGFQDAVGATYLPGARFVSGTSASDFQSRFDQVKGGAFLQAFETLKGGGSITNIEGEKGTAALNRMNLAQSEQEFVQAAREFQGIVRAGVKRAQEKVPGAASGEWSVVK